VARHDDEQLGDRAVRAPELLAVDDVRVPLGGQLRGRRELRRVGPDAHLGERERRDRARGAPREEALLLVGVPKILTGCGTPIDWWADSSAEMLPS
jgi:hypothetical protein